MTITETIRELITDLDLPFYHGVTPRQFAAIDEATILPAALMDMPKRSRQTVEADGSVSSRWTLVLFFLGQDQVESIPDSGNFGEIANSFSTTESIIQDMREKSITFTHSLINAEDSTGRKVFIEVVPSEQTDVGKITNRILSGVMINIELLPMERSMQC